MREQSGKPSACPVPTQLLFSLCRAQEVPLTIKMALPTSMNSKHSPQASSVAQPSQGVKDFVKLTLAIVEYTGSTRGRGVFTHVCHDTLFSSVSSPLPFLVLPALGSLLPASQSVTLLAFHHLQYFSSSLRSPPRLFSSPF